MKSILNVKNVEKYYGNKDNVTKALDNISFTIDKGEFIGIMGPSGSGKTTLLNCISTIDKVTTGRIEIDGADITRLRGKKLDKFRMNKLGFIFQDFNLLDTLTAYENISLALTIGGMKGKEIRPLIEKAGESLGITDVLNKYPYEMSGGQKQRVIILSALLSGKKILFFDEPTSGLDYRNMKIVAKNIKKVKKKDRLILIISHDIEFLESVCDSIVEF